MTTDQLSPSELGYRWPAEWEPHRATWLSWPHNRSTWPGCFDSIPVLYARLVARLAQHEPVMILDGDGESAEQAHALVGGLSNVTLLPWRTNDAWIRDYGPTFLQAAPGNPRALVHWRYNAWGGKYPPWDLDRQVPTRVAHATGYRTYTSWLTLEGGAIEGNGQGTVLATESCLLHRNRNPASTRATVEHCVRRCLGAEQIVWLRGGGIGGDDTDGHVDQLARFVRSDTIVAATTKSQTDPDYRVLRENLDRLSDFRGHRGAAFQVVPLPLPEPLFHGGSRLPASYCNFYVANGLVLVPQFDDRGDQVAHAILRDLFPNHDVVGFPARELVRGLGALHCLTQQQPQPEALLDFP